MDTGPRGRRGDRDGSRGGSGNNEEQKHKSHVKSKRKPDKKVEGKGFTFSSARNASKAIQRQSEMQQKKLHVPIKDQSINIGLDSPLPPLVIVVAGPKGIGKSTLMRSLIKRYTRQNINDPKGPITLVASRKQRITLIECPNDLAGMIDTCKIADLVLLMINANDGFTMDTFEMLNIMQVHGFPRVIGVLNHLDLIKNPEKLKETKKKLKHRFWAELYQGAKLFYLSELHHGHYSGRDVLNLSRFIANIKLRPLSWRNSHSYAIADRFEDLTPTIEKELDENCDRKVCFYGFLRGIPFRFNKEEIQLHIPGAGDFSISEMTCLADPCPLPDKKNTGKKGRRTLNDKQRVIYAPFSDVSGIIYDQDAIYVDMPTNQQKTSRQNDKSSDNDDDSQDESIDSEEGEGLMAGLKASSHLFEEKVKSSKLNIFKDAQPIKAEEYDHNKRTKDMNDDDEDDDDEENDKLEYNNDESEDRDEEDKDSNEYMEKIRAKFRPKEERECDDKGMMGGKGFEDLEDPITNSTPHQGSSLPTSLEEKKAALRKQFDKEFSKRYDPQDGDVADSKNLSDQMKASWEDQKKANKKALEQFDSLKRIELEGFQSGSYVRIVIDKMPMQFVKNFNPRSVIVLGGLLPHETLLGLVQVKIKRHRWFPKTIKNNEPLIISLGWRRFQTIPLLSMKDGTRNRLIKYTPDHLHCLATFYGPVSADGIGLCAFRSIAEGQSGFRISATGIVEPFDKSIVIMKKLKLVGYPYTVHRNTAFIKDMFTSELEVSKFEGASIRTVSGIRGQIKKSVRTPPGAFRAGFEDKILKSDIVFLRTWFAIQPRNFYNPMTDKLAEKWNEMRLNAKVRESLQIPIHNQKDSHYNPIEREERKFNPLRIARNLQKDLPFASKPKLTPSRHDAIDSKNKNKKKKKAKGKDKKDNVIKQTYMQKRAVMLEPEERKERTMVQQLRVTQKIKDRKRRDKQRAQHETYIKKKQVNDEQKETKKRHQIMRQLSLNKRKRTE